MDLVGNAENMQKTLNTLTTENHGKNTWFF